MELASQILSDVVVFSKYSRHIESLGRRETWDEVIDRNKAMHLKKFPQLKSEIEKAYEFVYRKDLLPSMRSLQFGGKAIELNNARLYNCAYLPIDDWEAFHEVMFLLLSGCGVGYSVQKHHVERLQEITKPTKSKRYLVQDSIIGWADAVKALMKAYFQGRAKPEFDFSDIRPKGAKLKTSGGIAPGPEPLKDCLYYLDKILSRKATGERLTTLEVHDCCCFISDCVLAGGIRRAAMIALFSLDDDDLLTSKFGEWYELNSQRARANNSVVLLRHRITEETFSELWEKMRFSNSGEPGFAMSNDQNYGTNPCGEIALRPFEFCNLVEINAMTIQDQEDLEARARAAAFIATLQASYTDFHYLRDCWKQTTEKDALIGIGLTGIATGKLTNLDLTKAVKIIKEENVNTAKTIGINPATRCTTVKPSGTASLVLGCSSGIHAWHSQYYVRRLRLNKLEPIYNYLANKIPQLIEDDYFKPKTEAVLSIPQKAPDGVVTREEPAVALLERVKTIYEAWVVPGHRQGHNKNNVSTTVTIKPSEWEEVKNWMWQNRDRYGALSILPYDYGVYKQPPFEDITKEQYESLVKYLTQIDLKEVKEFEDTTTRANELACSGSSCELTTA